MGDWRENAAAIRPYVAGEQPKDPGMIKLNANENPYPPSPAVAACLADFSAETLRRYPSLDGKVLRRALAERAGVTPASVFVANGSDEVLALAFRAFFNSAKQIYIPEVTYSFYPVWCRLFAIPFRPIPLGTDFRIDPEDYAGENGGVVVANPNAPTGLSLARREVKRLLELNRDVVVIIDEAYVDFGGESAVSLIGEYDNLLVTQTFSKGRSLAGLRVGMAYGDPDLIGVLDAVKNAFNSYPLDRVAEAAAAAALADEAWFGRCVEQIKAVRAHLTAELRRLGFSVTDSDANFVFATHARVSAPAILARLKSRGILVRHFDVPGLENHLRISVGTESETAALLAETEAFLRECHPEDPFAL